MSRPTSKIRVIIEADLPDDLMSQIGRTGFSVRKYGSKMRLMVGERAIAHDKATILFEEVKDVNNTGKPGGPAGD